MVATLMSLPYSCATKAKSVDKQKVETSESTIQSQNVQSDYQFSQNTYKEDFSLSEFSSALSTMNWQYNGETGQIFDLEISKTNNGYKVSASGSGAANGGISTVDSKFSKYETELELLKCQIQEQSEVINTLRKSSEIEIRQKQVDKKSTSVPTGLMIIGMAIMVLIVLIGAFVKR